ncbi:MAG TPA: hypothetical protein ENN05_00485 [Deltaproteobacteria bacterium]|nr:hypothetical protein [Deltaproteobacteria bacterium]
MGRITFFAGIAVTTGGFCVLIYQALMYLMHNTWTQYTLLTLVENGPQSLLDLLYPYPVIDTMLGSCPLFLSLIILGLVLLLIGSKIQNRYN